jgi:CPA2 family monovalent cation:H+ antiporter-2
VRLVNLRRASGRSEAIDDALELQMGDTLVLSGNTRTLALAEEKLLRG